MTKVVDYNSAFASVAIFQDHRNATFGNEGLIRGWSSLADDSQRLILGVPCTWCYRKQRAFEWVTLNLSLRAYMGRWIRR